MVKMMILKLCRKSVALFRMVQTTFLFKMVFFSKVFVFAFLKVLYVFILFISYMEEDSVDISDVIKQ